MTMAECPGCKGWFPEIEGPTHAYLTVSPGCWARFGRALALHYSDYRYWPAHQLLTDAYSLQHSRSADRRTLRSTHVHLGSLYAQLRLGQAEARVISLRRALSEFDFNELPTIWPTPSTSILDVDMSCPAGHLTTVEVFAKAVLNDWAAFHGLADRLCRIREKQHARTP